MKYARARSRSIVFAHFGIFHSRSISGERRGLRQVDLHALARRFHERRVDEPRERRHPEPRERTSARVEREVVARALVVPARAHHPAVGPVLQVALLRLRVRRLVPRVARVDRVAERVLLDEDARRRPSRRRYELPSRMRMPRLMSTRSVVMSLPSTTMPGVTYIARPHFDHRLVLVVDDVRILERAPAAEQDAPFSRRARSRAAPRRRSRRRRR